MEAEIKIIRTLFNQLIIGKTTETSHLIKIIKPYSIQLDAEGIMMYPLDQEIIGKEIEKISLDKSNLMYWTNPGEKLTEHYIKATTGIETKKPDIIT